MRYFVPKVVLGVLLPEQHALEDKFGGLPWGLPVERWPYCKACSKPQSLLAQLTHHPTRLDLGREGRVLFVFQCDHNPGGCPTWVGESGANACFVMESHELGTGLTDTPTFETTIEVEARVMEWVERDDGLTSDECGTFWSDEKLAAMSDEARDRVYSGTKIGSVPSWLQSAEEGPKSPWSFIAQIDCCHQFDGAPPDAEQLGSVVTRQVDGKYVHEEPFIKKRGAPPWVSVRERSWICDAANFGDMGRAYVFVSRDSEPPRGWFFWQC